MSGPSGASASWDTFFDSFGIVEGSEHAAGRAGDGSAHGLQPGGGGGGGVAMWQPRHDLVGGDMAAGPSADGPPPFSAAMADMLEQPQLRAPAGATTGMARPPLSPGWAPLRRTASYSSQGPAAPAVAAGGHLLQHHRSLPASAVDSPSSSSTSAPTSAAGPAIRGAAAAFGSSSSGGGDNRHPQFHHHRHLHHAHDLVAAHYGVSGHQQSLPPPRQLYHQGSAPLPGGMPPPPLAYPPSAAPSTALPFWQLPLLPGGHGGGSNSGGSSGSGSQAQAHYQAAPYLQRHHHHQSSSPPSLLPQLPMPARPPGAGGGQPLQADHHAMLAFQQPNSQTAPLAMALAQQQQNNHQHHQHHHLHHAAPAPPQHLDRLRAVGRMPSFPSSSSRRGGVGGGGSGGGSSSSSAVDGHIEHVIYHGSLPFAGRSYVGSRDRDRDRDRERGQEREQEREREREQERERDRDRQTDRRRSILDRLGSSAGRRSARHLRHGSQEANMHEGLQEAIAELMRALEVVEGEGGLTAEQLVMLEASRFFGQRGLLDEHHAMRMDVDNMSYEELLALGDRIGSVSTGVAPESIPGIVTRLRVELPAEPRPHHSDVDVKCTVCQEEYSEGEEVAQIACGHVYHALCIEQWLVIKNACPVCKAPAAPEVGEEAGSKAA
eukprot:SM000085S23268  [mRNA]  locus=s85:417227:419832:+ [translate_table: standard]